MGLRCIYEVCFSREKKHDNNFVRPTSTRSSVRASFRGEIRSSMIQRASIRSRKSVAVPENEIA